MARKASDGAEAASQRAAAGMNVRVEFEIRREDGSIVDSRSRDDPLEFVCGEGLVFGGLDRGVQGMAVGETRTLELSGEDAFGARDNDKVLELPAAQIPPGVELGAQLKVTAPDGDEIWARVTKKDAEKAVLDLNHPLADVPVIVSVTLLACEEAPELPPIEMETAAPGDGKTFPSKGERVSVHYAGALAATGEGFLSTRSSGEPLTFVVGLGQVIPGLDQAIQQMSLGERASMRIPASMAYGEEGSGQAVPPNSDILLDVELLKIE